MSRIKEAFAEEAITRLRASMPEIMSRSELAKQLGGALAKGTLANLSSQKIGPKSLRVGRNVLYLREDFLAWFFVYLSGGVKALKSATEACEEDRE